MPYVELLPSQRFHQESERLNAYLEMAHRVLQEARRPLPPREILRLALSSGLVPSSLYGKTQHKTLQARLSEDILLRRERSTFFRTKPGHFFLREFLRDTSIPAEYRTPIVARRRRRELAYPQPLALEKKSLSQLCQNTIVGREDFFKLLHEQQFHYADSSRNRATNDVLVWSFITVFRSNLILTYRHGRYREDRDSFLQKRSVGFFCPVVHDDLTLFDQDDHGIVASGIRALALDLNLTPDAELESRAELKCFVCTDEHDLPNLLGIIALQAPDWFEPLTRRLAINDLSWHDIRVQLNHYEDFDPWSRLILQNISRVLGGRALSADATAAF
ncbi:winged helix-turn-helix domain-containing protein [Bradyrhizobium sp. SZCCHNR2012]|uniref:winged helix-turn-helix domain-containing protein n=1 Tax=Bradyrhizobium sp. SZCCHNR2012 TaxID=3057377 RepID=UPI0028E45331|nr:winged helix-turn-helix domain-containing protein [Bradyrhizobium sp. SZCCHNR2012]